MGRPTVAGPSKAPHSVLAHGALGIAIRLLAAIQILADALLLKASGHSDPLAWPLTEVAPPTPGLYLSTDVWPSLVLGGLAVVVWVVDRRVVQDGSSR